MVKAEQLLGYRADTDLEAGLRRTIAWSRELGPQQPHYLGDGLELVTDDVPITWRDKLL